MKTLGLPQSHRGHREDLDPLSHEVIGAAIEVHRQLGPGLLESTYSRCLEHELKERGLVVDKEVEIPVSYKGLELDCGYRIDLLVSKQLVIELKAVDKLHDIHEAQLLTYLKLSGKTTGLLINFNQRFLKDGVKRLVV